ncbi:MAG: sortase [Actinomycetota bacterium]
MTTDTVDQGSDASSAPGSTDRPGTPTSARVLGAVGRGLITAGVVVLLFVVFQLWGTNIQEARAQDGLRDDFDDAFSAAQTQLALFTDDAADDPVVEPDVIDAGQADDIAEPLPDPTPTSTLPGGFDPEVLEFFFPKDGDAVARIEIPSIGVDKIVVNGVQVADLRKGPGHYSQTAPVGTEGNTSIAGHRTTYGAPFNRIDELQPGDEIHVTGVLGRFTYRVLDPQTAYPEHLHTVDSAGDGHIIVKPNATWVLGDFRDNRVTLTACHPKLSSAKRIIVAAELVDEPEVIPEFAPELIADILGEDAAAPVADTTPPDVDLGADESPAPTNAATAGLDEGLSGERDAIPGGIMWLLAASAIWVAVGYLARRLFDDRTRRIAVRMAGLLPAGYCLWFAFEMIDRALPAG